MTRILILMFFAVSNIVARAQSDTVSEFIFIPHPRSDDNVNQSVLGGIELIDFSTYEMILLGGDLTYYTSISRTSMDYCDSLFNLGDPNTLWTMGNHDLTSRSLVEEYTGRPSFYSYSFNNITFLVLDTELDAAGFNSSHISGDQLEMIRQVCDTIAHSDYLILLHHRLLWMIGNDYFSSLIDSVGQSTRQLDTSNFNTVVYPMLQQTKSRGVPVICLGGDRSMVNIEYTPEDSLIFIASTMVPEFTDAENDVVIISWDVQTRYLNWEFLPLDQVEKKTPVSSSMAVPRSPEARLRVRYNQSLSAIEAIFQSSSHKAGLLEIVNLSGQRIFAAFMEPGSKKTIIIEKQGIYLVRICSDDGVETQKICVP